MRKRFFFTCLMSMLLGGSLSANIIIDDPIVNEGNNNNKGGRTIVPSCNLTADGNMLFISIEHYVGSAQVTVTCLGTSSTTISNFNVGNGYSCVSLDCDGYENGEYTLIITLQDGQVYSGSFRKE